MSTLKVASINNPAAASGGLTISATGAVSGAGLDHIVTETFTAQSAVSVDDCFSAEYENYRVVLSSEFATGTLQFRLRASGTDSSTNYNWRRLIAEASVSTLTGAATSIWVLGYASTVTAMDIFGPYIADETHFAATSAYNAFTAGVPNTGVFTGNHSATSAYDGFTAYPSSGTMTGSLSIYGYKS